MGEMSKFQILLLGIFTFFIVAGVMSFALYKGLSQSEHPLVTVWGTLPAVYFDTLSETVEYKASGIRIDYFEKSATSFDSEFVNALAEGKGPDLVLLPQNLL